MSATTTSIGLHPDVRSGPRLSTSVPKSVRDEARQAYREHLLEDVEYAVGALEAAAALPQRLRDAMQQAANGPADGAVSRLSSALLIAIRELGPAHHLVAGAAGVEREIVAREERYQEELAQELARRPLPQ